MSEYRPEAWTDGEETVFVALCEATQTLPGKTAFKGVLPPQLDTWALTVSDGNESSPFKDMAPTEIKFDGIVQGQYASNKRDLGQRVAMQWLHALPIRQESGPVYVARATRPPSVVWGYIPIISEGKETGRIGAWLVTLEIECVFRVVY